MARTSATLPGGSRITDLISLGVLAKTFPRTIVDEILLNTGKASKRQRDMPAHVVVYYIIAMTLLMNVSCREVLRCLLEGLQWLVGPNSSIKVTGKSGISQARNRLGAEPLEQLHDRIVAPVAIRSEQKTTRGAWYGQWRLVSLDGSTLDVADTADNDAAFGRPGASRGSSAFPQIRLVSLVENGTHVLFGSKMGGYRTSENDLAASAIVKLQPGMLCLADRNFFSYNGWQNAHKTGADLVWRVKKNLRLPCRERFADGSYLSRIYASDKDRRRDRNGIDVRVIEYQIEGVEEAEPIYRLVTTILDPDLAPAMELAQLYHDRWEIETAFDEFKTHLRGARIVLRSKTPELVRQEFYGFLMTHFAIRGLMHEAAVEADEDPDRLSFTHAVRVVRRKLSHFATLSPPRQEMLAR